MTGARELLTKRSPRATFDSLSKLPAGHRRLTADENSRMTGFDKLISFLKSRVSKERRRAFRRYFVFHFRGIQSLACRLVFGSNLRAIAHYYGTDKWGEHRYAEHYETLFAPLSARSLRRSKSASAVTKVPTRAEHRSGCGVPSFLAA